MCSEGASCRAVCADHRAADLGSDSEAGHRQIRTSSGSDDRTTYVETLHT